MLRSSTLFALLVGCTLTPEARSATPPASPHWLTHVQQGIVNRARSFQPDGEGFRAEGHTFDAHGAWIATGGAPIGVMSSVGGPPRLGACTRSEDPAGECLRRLEYTEAGQTEWWENGPDGLQQGWIIEYDPGDLRIAVSVTDAVATGGGAELWLDGADGEAVLVSGLNAWDADGNTLPAWFEPSATGFVVSVDDRGARYPVEIDPVYTTAAYTWSGAAAGDYLGVAVSDAGDIDADGYDDVLVGSSGAAYVYYGSASGLPATADATRTGSGYFGCSLSEAGDINNDGYADVLIGNFGGYTGSGSVYIYHGGASGLDAASTTTLTDSTSGTYFGLHVTAAGDVNGDGYDDVAVGASFHSSLSGRATVYLGSAAGVSSTAATTITGGSQQGMGYGLSGAGDVNNDGYDDLIVGAYYANYREGAAFVHLGSATGLSSSPATSLAGTGTGSFGWAVRGMGDIDGDGYDDIAVSSPFVSVGQVDVYHGSATGIPTSPTQTISGPATAASFGYDLGAADVNGDGYADLLAGAPHTDSVTGTAYLYEGSASGLSTTPTTLIGTSSGEIFGSSLSSAGDVDGDGYDDVIVGAEYARTNYGTAYVFLGYTTDPPDDDEDGYTVDDDCNDADAAVHPGATEVCDAADVDEDCDSLIDDADDSVTGQVQSCLDGDLDTYGTDCVLTCEPAAGSAENGEDCDDADAAINPAAAEICDPANTDEDCDALADDADDSVTDQRTVYADGDGDGYGADPAIVTCDGDTYSTVNSDCDDNNDTIHPAAAEIPDNGIDEDCTGGDGVSADDVDSGDTDTGDKEAPPCACGSTSGAAWGWLAAAAAIVVRRRRTHEGEHPKALPF